jgi:tetratricopeptide (TPR) repeat protein
MGMHPAHSPKEAETETVAMQALQRGENARARALSEAMLADHPDSPVALRLLGLVNMIERHYQIAIDAFTRSVELSPDLGAFINLTTCLTKVNDLERAVESGRAAVAMAPAAVPARLALAAALQGKRRLDDALAEVNEASRLSPGNPTVAMRRGAIRAQLGHYEAAQEDFALAATSNETPQVRAVRFDRAFYDTLADATPDRVPQPAPMMSMGDAGRARYVVYVGCTADYFLKYGIVFVNSYAANSASGSLLHLHIVNPGEEFGNAMSDISRRLPDLNLVVTTERAPIDAALDPANSRSYYACARFLQLPGFLAHYQKPMLSFDVDAVVEAPLERILDHVGSRDMGLVLREPVDSPWWDIIAFIIGVRPTPATLAYLCRVRNYILHFFERRQMPWALDQLSLYCVLKMMERFDKAPTVAWLPREVQAVTWQIGQAYDYKLSDARVRRYK